MNNVLAPAEYPLILDPQQAHIEFCESPSCENEATFIHLLPTEEDEDEWIVKAKQGEEGAFVQLYDRYYSRIYRYIACRIKRVQDVEDLTQQVFLQALSAIGRYEQRNTPFKAWLFTIAYHLVVNEYRRKPIYELNDGSVDQRPDSDPENVAVAHWQQERLSKAISQLLPLQRLVILLRFSSNLQSRQIAGMIGKSEVNVRVTQHRALRQLRNILKDEARDGFQFTQSLDH